jgi:hypothetical protein
MYTTAAAPPRWKRCRSPRNWETYIQPASTLASQPAGKLKKPIFIVDISHVHTETRSVFKARRKYIGR